MKKIAIWLLLFVFVWLSPGVSYASSPAIISPVDIILISIYLLVPSTVMIRIVFQYFRRSTEAIAYENAQAVCAFLIFVGYLASFAIFGSLQGTKRTMEERQLIGFGAFILPVIPSLISIFLSIQKRS